MPRIAVAMSVYKSDRLDYLKQALDSLIEQTYTNYHIFIEVDGTVVSEVESYLRSLSDSLFTISFHKENKGLATRLNQAITKIVHSDQFEFIARMDSDDISHKERFQEQIKYMLANPNTYVLGSDVIEIDNYNNEIFYKKMQADSRVINRDIIKRCPVNHPSVMLKSEMFTLFGLRYRDELMNTQDYYLWVDVIYSGLRISNINKPLLKFRIDDNFHQRRGVKKSFNEFKSRLYAMKKLSIVSPSNITHTILLFMLRLSPEFMKRVAYKYMR